MNIALIICIPITALVVGFLIIKTFQLSLRWQMNVKQGKEPELKNPVAEIVKEHKAEKQAEMTQSIFDEWTNGAKE